MSLASKVKIVGVFKEYSKEYENVEVFFEGPWMVIKKDNTSYVYPIHLVTTVTIESAKLKSFDSIERN